ncbi:MAG: hypothetical protein R2713_12720 [Ilumatobacteraceae bacterium]
MNGPSACSSEIDRDGRRFQQEYAGGKPQGKLADVGETPIVVAPPARRSASG